MGWEQRKRGGLYYTTSERIGGRVVRRYIGAGELAQAISCLDEHAKTEREQRRYEQRAAIETVREEVRSVEQASSDIEELTDELFRVTMREAGYFQHKRGEWRKRRDSLKA
jgi:hypothetical protein